MATSNCLQIVNSMPQEDQDAILSRLEQLQAQGMSAKEAQLQAAIDVLAMVERQAQVRKSADRVTDTPEFKRWFGDSVVVDEAGKPLVVYHGSPRTDIDSFRDGGGHWFASNPKLAEKFLRGRRGQAKRRGAMYPVYLSMSKPLDLREFNIAQIVGSDFLPKLLGVSQAEWMDRLNKVGQKSLNEMNSLSSKDAEIYKKTFGKDIPPWRLTALGGMTNREEGGDSDSRLWSVLDSSVVRQALESFGYDGVLARELFPASTPRGKDVESDTYLVFKPTQIKSATGNSGQFDAGNPDIRKSLPRPQFYSQLQKAIGEVPDRLSTMAAPAWKQWLTANAPKLQVKADEVEWSGIKDYLDLQGKAKLSKADLSAYLDDSGVKIGESVLDGGVKWGVYDGDKLVSTFNSRSEAKAKAESSGLEYDSIRNPEAKYSQYTLPGGENYREVLLTLPTSSRGLTEAEMDKLNGRLVSAGYDGLGEDQRELARRGGNEAVDMLVDIGDRLGVRTDDIVKAMAGGDASKQYRSSHWDTANVLAHIRVNDRTDADGKRVLFVEEVQSDWGQEGKKKGFAEPESARLTGTAKPDDFGGWKVEWSDGTFSGGYDESSARAKAAEGKSNAKAGIPSAPFVTKTEGWLNLALKRIAMLAVEGGYDKVAFVNGEQSADRYDLSKQIGSVEATKTFQGKYAVTASDLSGSRVIDDVYDADKLPDVVGKDLAVRIVKEATTAAKPGERHSVQYRGLDLKVGGEGMKTFYDQIVPQALNKLLPKLGSNKLGAVNIGKQGDQWGVYDATDEENAGLYSRHATRAEADAAAKEFDGGVEVRRVTDATTQPGFDVTDKMRETVGKGLPLFSRDRAAPDSPEFRRWFANSVAVDEQGNPLVVYHGTGNLEGLEAFDPSLTGKGVDQLGSGFYFSTKPEEASGYTTALTQNVGAGTTKIGGDTSPGVVPVYLSIQNPIRINGTNLSDADVGITLRQATEIIKRAPNIRDMEETPLWDWVDLSRAEAVTDKMIVDAAKAYTESSLMSLGNDFFRNDQTAFRAAVRDVLGFDGVVQDFGNGHKHFVAWFPEQIKSAIGNNGEFNPENPSITKSADRPWFDDLGKLKVTTSYQLGDLFKSSRKLSWWDRTVGTQYNLAQKHPQFKRVFDAVQTFINDVSAYATRAADLAPSILPKLETLKDIAKSPLSAADVKALRDPIFGGTLKYMRDENGAIVETDDVQAAGVVFTDDELRSMFGLNDRQVGLYREFRATVNQSLSDLAISDMIRYLGEDGADIRESVMASGNVDVAAGVIESHLNGMIAAAPARAEVLRNTIDAIQQKAEQANSLMDRGYAPLSRFGQFTVYAVGKNGEQLYFGMFETQRDANKMAREMAEQYPEADVTTGTMSQESYKLFSGVTPETLALFGESLGLEESGVDPKSEVFQQYLKMAKTNRSAMKRLIERKGIDGYSEDAGRVLAGFVVSNARQVATNLHAGEIGRSAAAVTDGDVKDAAIRLMQYIQNPQEEAQALRGLMFTQFIGGSIASAMVNMTQPWTMTLPYLSQFGGATNAGKLMAEAVKLASRGIKGDQDLQDALKRAEDDGVVSPQEIHQLMGQAQGKGSLRSGDGTAAGDAQAKANNFKTKLMLGWGRVFSAAEQFNRRVTFIAAYKLARERGMDNPFQFAEQAIAETQGVYNKGNKPAWARGAVGGTLFTFKQYSIGYVEFLRRMWGNGPEGKKAVALALGVLFLMSGFQGIPGMDDMDDVVDGFAQRVLGRSFDSKAAKKQFFASILGQSGAEFVMSGISGLPGAPIDVSGRMGLGNLIPGTGLLTKKRDYGRDYLEVVGPAGTLFTNAGTSLASVASGEFRKAGEALLPVAAQNWVKSADMATMGFYRDQKGRKVVDTDGFDAFAKALGFQPRAVAQVQDATATQANLITQNKLRETEIADKWAKGRIERKPELIEQAQQDLADWNSKNPDSPIRIDQAQINKRVQEANKSKAQRVAATAPKEIRQSVKRELERESN